jgi:dTDP-4-dehydrorhamnose 3,5-epimerase
MTVKVIASSIPELLVLETEVFTDERGFFFESFNERAFANSTGINVRFVQDNHSRSVRNVLRGLHYQILQPQGKLVRVSAGEVFDVAVDLRKSSVTFGKWSAKVLSEKNKRMSWVPPGFAHGFLVTGDYAEVQYKTTDYWAPQHERCILWNDPDLGITWPLIGEPTLSKKDQAGKRLRDAEVFP